jgi:hypothetical protein
MKKFYFLLLILSFGSCISLKKSGLETREEEIIVTRKYIGNFIDYYHTDPKVTGNSDLIWIKTTVYSSFGKLSAYSKECRFVPGERIYLQPVNASPGNYGYWEYKIENDSAVSYRVSDYRYENNMFVKSRSL